MIFKDDQAAIDFIKASQAVPQWVTDARTYSVELCALVNGESFAEQLITNIEKIESEIKAAVRKKYARNIIDFFERLNLPCQNVFSSTGGVKNYQNGDVKLSEVNQKKLLKTISNIRDGKSVERYIETQWMNLYRTDPAGVIWMRYKTDNNQLSVYPTYHGIGVIRTYTPKGQLVDNILFEPTPTKEGDRIWIVVDDLWHRIIIQKGENYTVDNEKSFKHPFGQVPVIINSDLVDKKGNRLSPIHTIIPLAKEYARDQSIKTIYKFLQGFPKHWRRTMICKTCHGNGKNGDVDCVGCSGKGEYGKGDVADQAILPFPEKDEPVLSGDDIMGYVSPDIDTWKQFTDELEWLESEAYFTHWGVKPLKEITGVKTATEVHADTQPQINRLNKYADVAEWMEWTITEWVANAIDTSKNKDASISLIVYGRRYILEGIDTIQKKYEAAKEAGENNVVLDAIFDELLTVKFKNDPANMAQELKKARLEPYIHQSLTEINNIFGANECARKIYFQRWWKGLSDADLNKDVPMLQTAFDTAFDAFLPTIKILKPVVATADPAATDPKTE